MDMVLMLLIGLVVGAALGVLWARSRPDHAETTRLALETRAAEHAVVRESLDRLHDQVRDLESHRISWQSQLRQQVDDVRHSTDLLRRETSGLAPARRKPQVRGRWGELQLKRAVEIAGLVNRCDFSEQVHLTDDEAVRRPDVVIHLAGGKKVVVDAKVPLDAFLDATSTDDEDERDAHLRKHARQLKQHVDGLASKGYWRLLEGSPEFVVLFLPGESFLSAALDVAPDLIEYAAQRQVVLATPTTLIALLRTVAFAWKQETLAERAQDIHALGRDLHDRLGVLGGHLDGLGRALSRAVSSYNETVGSLESRVLVSARRFHDYAIGEELPSPAPVTVSPRPLTAPELLDRTA